MIKIKTKLITKLCVLFSISILNTYASNLDLLNNENLKVLGKTSLGNSRLFIYEEDNGTHWVLREYSRNDAFSSLKYDADTYITSKILNVLTNDSIVPIVAEVKLLSNSFGTASKWLTEFTPLADHGIKECWWGAVHPKEINGNLILNREKIILATDFTGTLDRNEGNIGVVKVDNQYLAAQVDYNETFNFNGFTHLVNETLNNNLDINSVLTEINRVIDLPNSSIELLIDETKEEFTQSIQIANTEKLGFLKYTEKLQTNRYDPYKYEKKKYGNFGTENEFKTVLSNYISNYIDKVKSKIIRQKNQLIEIKKLLLLHKAITENNINSFKSIIENEYNGVIPQKLEIKQIDETIEHISDDDVVQKHENYAEVADVLDLIVKAGSVDMLHILLADAYKLKDYARMEKIENSFALAFANEKAADSSCEL